MAGNAELADRLAVLERRVSDIGLPAIARIPGCQPVHDPIARDLCNNGGGGNREAERVSFDNGLHRAGNRWSNSAVDESGVGAHPEHGHSAGHREQSRAQDVEAVYFACARRTDPDTRGSASGTPPERVVASLPLLSGQRLRIIEPLTQQFREPAGLENHRGGDHRPGQRPTSGLIDTAHQPSALPLDREIRHRLFTPPCLCHDAGQPGKRPGGGRFEIGPARETGLQSGAAPKDRYVDRVSRLTFPAGRRRPIPRPHRASAVLSGAVTALYFLAAMPAGGFDLFAQHEVTAQFATPDGKPMVNAEVRAFAPGDPTKPAVTGRTDSGGKFTFAADRDGFWSAEARTPDYVTRIMIRVGGEQQSPSWLSSVLVVAFLVVMLALAIWYRWLRMRAHHPKP